ncbi:ATP-binding protein [Actinosynnema sp. CS-041913]|uniref:ATP-binding protein n=1 Tax=Actinosynnema sp. CS-041913 TaxID=3239917 RepID=UPI003D8A2706
MSLDFQVALEAGAAVVRPTGLLDLTTYVEFRDGLLKCALDEPLAVVVVLDEGFAFATPAAMSVFTTVWMRVSEWPGVPVLLVGASQPHRATLEEGGAGRYVRHFRSVADALTAAGERPVRRRDDTWLPDSAVAALLARRFVRETCRRWQLSHLLDAALLVASELVENAVHHARSAPHLRLELRADRLTIAVRDDAEPMRKKPATPWADGHGLSLVERFSRVWGSSPWPGGGKVVWAVLGD